MTIDLAMLTASAVLTGCLVLPYGFAMWTQWRIVYVLGNRENPPALPPWAEPAIPSTSSSALSSASQAEVGSPRQVSSRAGARMSRGRRGRRAANSG